MSVVEAAAVQQERIYVSSGFVEDDYIRDDSQPTSRSLIGNTLILGVANVALVSAVVLTASNVTTSTSFVTTSASTLLLGSGRIGEFSVATLITSAMDCPSRLKWNPQDNTVTGWGDDGTTTVTWAGSASASVSFTQKQGASSIWQEVEDNQESPFG